VHECAENLTEIFAGSSFLNYKGILRVPKQMAAVAGRHYNCFVNEPDEIPPKQNYKWPWFVAAAVLLFVALAVVFVSFKAHQIREERNFNAPIPAGGK
jgi:hypothetical protein